MDVLTEKRCLSLNEHFGAGRVVVMAIGTAIGVAAIQEALAAVAVTTTTTTTA